MFRILLVDDERALREGLKTVLVGEGFSVAGARNGEDALKKYFEGVFDLVLLDVMMPGMNGFRVFEELRRRDASVAVVFLTARDTEADEVRALGMGADDFVSKSASEAVLVARIRSALQRRLRALPAERGEIGIGPMKANLDRLELELDGTVCARLTRTEADILRLFDSDRGRYFSRDEIVEALRGEGFACEDSMLYSHISNLRRKLSQASDMIENDRKVGYRLLK